MRVAIRVDVCIRHAIEQGLEPLLRLLDRAGVPATICVASGPDRSGLAVFQALRDPSFLRRMLRMGPARTFGWRTLLSGTLLPASEVLAAPAPSLLAAAAAQGHELAFHGFDHRGWQRGVETWAASSVRAAWSRQREIWEAAGLPTPRGFAAPGWRTSGVALAQQARERTAWGSDLRGDRPAWITVGGGERLLQIPVNLPTLDELWAVDAPRPVPTARHLLERVEDLVRHPVPPPVVYAAHAELEGRAGAPMLSAFLEGLKARGARFVTLSEIEQGTEVWGERTWGKARCRGRAGWVSALETSGLDWLEPWSGGA